MEGLSTTLQECLHEFSVLADEDLLVSEGRGVGGGGGARAGCTRGLARDQVADARAPVTRAVEGGGVGGVSSEAPVAPLLDEAKAFLSDHDYLRLTLSDDRLQEHVEQLVQRLVRALEAAQRQVTVLEEERHRRPLCAAVVPATDVDTAALPGARQTELLRLQLDAAKRQVSAVRRECEQVQRLCDEVCEEVERQRQMRREQDVELRRVNGQLEDLCDESIARAKTLRHEFEQALAQEREASASLGKQLETERAETQRLREECQRLSQALAEMRERGGTMSTSERYEEPALRIRAEEPLLERRYETRATPVRAQAIGTKRAEEPALSFSPTRCNNPKHRALFYRLHEVMKERDLWMQESRALARSLSFLKRSFHYG